MHTEKGGAWSSKLRLVAMHSPEHAKAVELLIDQIASDSGPPRVTTGDHGTDLGWMLI